MNYRGVFENKEILVEGIYAFDYAIERILQGSEKEKSEFKEWYFSGDWVEEKEGE